MLVTHIATDEHGRTHLWAEDSSRPPQHPPSPGRPPKAPEPREHPFAASHETLRETCGELGLPSDTFESNDVTVLLPSGRFGPEASPQLVRDEELDGPVDQVSPWTVPTLVCAPTARADVLGTLAEGDVGIIAGETVRYWNTAASLADELVRGGRVVPHLTVDDDLPRSIWRALPSTSEDFSRLRSLRESMPPLARARVTDEVVDSLDEAGVWGAADVTDARDVLVSTLDTFVDGIARDRLTASDVCPGAEDGDTHERWLASLGRADGHFDADSAELETLREQLDEWTRSLETRSQDGVRLCFRLWPPEPDVQDGDTDELVAVSPDGWELEFLLQAADDPSLIVEASTVWESSEATTEVLDRHLERPQETLLSELGRAASLYPALERALDESTPTTLELTADEADAFLRERADLLEQSGFGVVLPAWWNEPQRQLGARLTADSGDSSDSEDSVDTGEGVGTLGVDRLCDVRWEVVLGNETVSKEELEELATLKVPLVRVRGQWVSLQDGDVDHALELYEKGADQLTAGDVLGTASGLSEPAVDLPVVDYEFEGTLARLSDADLEEWAETAATPPGFDGELRPYQERGLGWIRYLEQFGFGGCLADDMGLGKTIQILARLVDERADGTSPGPTLVVCPLSVVGNWKHETRAFGPGLDVTIHHGINRASGDRLADVIQTNDVIVTTYGVVRNDIAELRKFDFHRAVLDEAQKIKNTEAQRTQAVKSLSAPHRFALTGTPVENRLSELWSIMDFCNPGLLGTQEAFQETFARPIERYGDERATEQLRRLIRPFVLRREKTDERIIDDLPEKVEIKEYCTLTEEQATLYKAATDELMTDVEQSEGIDRRGKVLQLLNALKAICNHPRQYHEDDTEIAGRSGKLARLDDLATEILDTGDRALIFTQYTSMAELIRAHLQERLGRRVLYLHGGTPQGKRDELVDQFQSTDGPPFFLLSLRAGGTGLTLTAANHVIHYDRWWNPAVEDQATDRTYRIGQTDDVQVHKLICQGTVEEAIDETIERKRDLAEQVLTGDDEWITDLSDDELRDLITLSEDIQ